MEPETAPNLILAGPMGVGKSSVGLSLAARLGLRFLDFDVALERRFGMTVAEVFARHGEPVFRAAEAELCQSLAAEHGLVAATGGGAIVPAANRAALNRAGVLVCLTCTPEMLLARLRANGEIETRPLLRDNPEEALRRVLEARRAAYESILLRVDTTNLSLTEVTEAVLALYYAATRRQAPEDPFRERRTAGMLD